MARSSQLIVTSVTQAFGDLKANKLRTFLSLLGITIGIFCIIAVLTVIDSMKNNIEKSMASLGSDVLYISKKPWMPEEGGEYKWWEYLRRKPMGDAELNAIKTLNGVRYASIFFDQSLTVKHDDDEVEDVQACAVSENFDKMQNIDVEEGRYLSPSELGGGTYTCVIGGKLRETLFPGGVDPIGKTIGFYGKRFVVVGALKPAGKNMAGFNYDNAIILPFSTVKSFVNLKVIDWNTDPMIMVKAKNNVNLEDLKLEVEGVLRTVRKVKPGDKKDFAINQLSQVTERINIIFGTINLVGWVIAGFSLLVGGFGIANIMFVTVKERTRIIGLKKAIGARQRSILMEFLIESITLCIIGGLIGIFIVLLLSLVLNYGADFPITLSLKNFFVGVTISAVVGMLAGFIPARSASRLDPVVAIRTN